MSIWNQPLRMLQYACAMALTTALVLWLAFQRAAASTDASGVWLAWPLTFVTLVVLFYLYLRKDKDVGYATTLLVATLSTAILLLLVALMVSPAAWPISIIHMAVAVIASVVAQLIRARSAAVIVQSGYPNTPDSTPPSAQLSGLETNQLKRLKHLHDNGTITDEQFASEKARILNR